MENSNDIEILAGANLAFNYENRRQRTAKRQLTDAHLVRIKKENVNIYKFFFYKNILILDSAY